MTQLVNLLASREASEFSMSEPMAFLIVFLILSTVVMAATVASYVFGAIGLRGMLRSVGFGRTWYGFVPVLNAYAIGYIADRYDNGKKRTHYAKSLLRLNIVSYALSFLFSLLYIPTLLAFSPSDGTTPTIVLAILAVFYIPLIAISVILSVKLYVSMWRIYRIFAPDGAVLYLLLSIFIPLAYSIIFFMLRNQVPWNTRVGGDWYDE